MSWSKACTTFIFGKKTTGILDEKFIYFLDTPAVFPLLPVVLVYRPPPLWEGGRNPHGVYQIDGMKFPDFSLIIPGLFQVIFFQVNICPSLNSG